MTGKEYSFVAKAIIKDKAGNTIESLTDTLYIEVAKPTLPEYFETNGEGKIVGFDSKYDAEIAKCSLLAIPQTIKHEDNTDETITSIADNAFHDVGGARYENIKYLLLDSS
ncbi:MAG: hypothetical protein MJ233_03155 [Mycoplasmoidaceae bacterium]|nr:hypothetical protein [Mycoplasmoidaceae bacterium]